VAAVGEDGSVGSSVSSQIDVGAMDSAKPADRSRRRPIRPGALSGRDVGGREHHGSPMRDPLRLVSLEFACGCEQNRPIHRCHA